MSLSPADYITIVFHQININNLGLESLETIMNEQKVPLAYYDKVKEEVIEKFKEEDFKIYAKFEQKNPDIIYCKKEDMDKNTYLSAYLSNKGRNTSSGLLNFNSEEILKSLPNPVKTNCDFQIKGLVIGQVQSGKTSNIEALICRAVDHGYRMIIVLSGRTNDLRHQTQKRFDTEVIENKYLSKKQRWAKLTTQERDYDSGSIGSIDTNLKRPKIAIIKKNVSVLKKILNDINNSGIENHPTLIIDDECDDASIDTNYRKPDIDPTSTNQKIRDIINSFKKIVYIGFSATPFANVFIDVNESEDLYPKDFIYLLNTPKDYTGSEELEKHQKNIFIDVVKGDEIDETFSKNLKDSIYTFIISCAICKNLNIDLKNYSMLIHPSRLKVKHAFYEDKVKEIVEHMKSYANRPDEFNFIETEFQKIFSNNFSKDTTEDFKSYLENIKFFIQKLDIQTINSDNQDRSCLNYDDKEKVYILIGGDILSRGLTIDGLLTSFFTREAKKTNYDTLIQMQRWCGFRKKYLKFTKIYTTEKLKNHFLDLVFIEKEFRKDVHEIYDKNLEQTPLDIQPMVRNHPSMNIVNPSKKGASLEKISTNAKFIKFHTLSFEEKSLEDNLRVFKEWIKDKNFTKKKRSFECSLNKEEIRKFIESYKCSREKREGKLLSERILSYIDRYHSKSNSDSDWDIIIHNPQDIENPSSFPIGDLLVNKVRRKLHFKDGIFNISILMHKDAIRQIKKPTVWFYIIDEKYKYNRHKKQKAQNFDRNIVAPTPILAFYMKFPRPSSLSGLFSTQDTSRC